MKRFATALACAVICAAVLAALSGCEQLNPRPKVDLASPIYAAPEPIVAPAVANGSIYQAAQFRPLFEDYRARLVGDSITIQIVEKISATQKSTSSIDKSGKVSASISALPMFSPNSFNRASAAGNSTISSAGAGTTENSNDFFGTITAVVTGVLPNGHLVVAGEKQIGVNHNVDVLRFSGQVDPRMIQPGNVVPSASVANVRIEQRGRGAQADAQGTGWLSRFFLNVLPI
jgi:flagellar L-ring protein precursor FlgH